MFTSNFRACSRGYNMIAEVDYFYPLPDSVDALRPKRKKLKPATTAPPPTTTLPPPPVEHFAESFDYHDGNHIFHSPEFDHHPELFVPDSGWKNDPNLADLRDVPPGVEVPAKDRIWSAQSGKTQVVEVEEILLQNNDIFSHSVFFIPSSQSPPTRRPVRSHTPLPMACTTATTTSDRLLEQATCNATAMDEQSRSSCLAAATAN